MAILKHSASKSSNYQKAVDYVLYEHDETTGLPLKDDAGNLIPRRNIYIDGINCDPDIFADQCILLNTAFGKNQSYDDIKSHHYILSFDPKDVEDYGLTPEKAHALGLEFAKKFFPGHQTIVCTHPDGHHGSGNIHCHIIFNSLRKFDVDKRDLMDQWSSETLPDPRFP